MDNNDGDNMLLNLTTTTSEQPATRNKISGVSKTRVYR